MAIDRQKYRTLSGTALLKLGVHGNLDPAYDIDSYILVDARIGLSTDRWSFAVLGKNLLDEKVITYSGHTPLSGSSFGTNIYYGFVAAPRTITAQAALHFQLRSIARANTKRPDFEHPLKLQDYFSGKI